MKVLVHPVDLEIGGSEINAIDLAAAVRDRGHDVVIFGRPGPLTDLVSDRKLRHVEAHFSARPRPSPAAMWELRRVVRQEQVDLVHAYEGFSLVEALYGCRLMRGVATVGTLYTMNVDRYLPRSVPMIAGTKQLQRQLRQEPARVKWGVDVPLLDPPVDVGRDAPSVDATAFRERHGLDAGIFTAVMVSRLDLALKLEGLSDAIRAVAKLAERLPIRLIIVGEGPMQSMLADQARSLNGRLGRQVVTLAGPMLDPRPAYAAADAVIGQGTSALRAMAMEKPVILAGEQAFYQVVSPETIADFFEHGFWGQGDGRDGPGLLASRLASLVAMDSSARRALGSFGRQLVVERFSLEVAGARLESIYQSCIEATRRRPRRAAILTDAAETALRVGRFKVEHRVDKYRHLDEKRTLRLMEP